MATKLDELIEVLDEIIQILESDGEGHWSRWMRKSRARLLNSDYSGIEHLLSAYGGMGSFNDLVICQSYEDGEFKWKEGYVEKNDRLDELRGKAWELADHIKRNHIISNS
jgi:hypothetical protein